MQRESPQSVTARLTIAGHVQGVGFRPFVYRIARAHGLTGVVSHRLGEVDVTATGDPAAILDFQHDLIRAAPPLAKPVLEDVSFVETQPFERFEIATSSRDANANVFVPPDYFMCDDCRRELKDPDNRRYHYPFINCTQCGPRYTLIERMPYDRPDTCMAKFEPCAACLAEYRDPADRRFHAEPIACPACGPQVCFQPDGVGVRTDGDAALVEAMRALAAGKIVAVKGIGGYHLLCDALDPAAVSRLRRQKSTPDKPLAVMFPIAGSNGLGFVSRYASVNPDEARLLLSPARPIVLVRKCPRRQLASNVAPGLNEIGALLPYSPLHQLLLDRFAGPLVATSGNLSGEPVLTDNDEAARRLSGVADAWLHHDRPIVRPADDPVYRQSAGKQRPLRLGRGAAPREIALPWAQPVPTLAVGGHTKSTVTLSWDRRAVVSPHIGEMTSPRSLAVMEQVSCDLQTLYGVRAEQIVCDAHPGYTTHRWARSQTGMPVETVWHHRAHASALAAEFDRPGPWLVFTWNGVGLGEDGSLWGGEALLGAPGYWRRVASLRPFRLPGGDRAGREPWRSAAALHWECGIDWRGPRQNELAREAWQKRLNCPETTAVGRLFDAASAMLCDLHTVSFEAQGPMRLEALCRSDGEPVPLPLEKDAAGIWRTDWQPLLSMLADSTLSRRDRAEAFHASLAGALSSQVERIAAEHRVAQVGLSGGVFQNRVLTEAVVRQVEASGLPVLLNRLLPVNDAALSFGQAAECAARAARGAG